jgi:hypothetical protein
MIPHVRPIPWIMGWMMRNRCRAPALAVMLVLAAGCGGDRAVQPTHPTPDRVVARPQAVGVPYDRYILIKDRQRLLALKLSSDSALGEHVLYEWEEIDPSGRGSPSHDLLRGTGETAERLHDPMGRIDIPDLSLVWSRGSRDLGWIYWPDDDREFAVYSRPWLRPAEIDPTSRAGTWLSKSR